VGPSTFTLKEWGSNLALPSLRGDLVSRPVEVCRGLSSCRAVELDTLTHRHMESRVALSSNCRVALTSCRVTVEFPVELSRPGLKEFPATCRLITRRNSDVSEIIDISYLVTYRLRTSVYVVSRTFCFQPSVFTPGCLVCVLTFTANVYNATPKTPFTLVERSFWHRSPLCT
jgi:hypothetical protein